MKVSPGSICVVSLETFFNYRPIPLKEVEGYFDNQIDTFFYPTEREAFESNLHRYNVVFLSCFHFNVPTINEFCQKYHNLNIVCGGYFINKHPEMGRKIQSSKVGLGDLLTVIADYMETGYSKYVYDPKDLGNGSLQSPFIPMPERKISYAKDFYVKGWSHHMMVYASRGSCPATCTFCARYAELKQTGQFGDFSNFKSPTQILEEIRQIEKLNLDRNLNIAIGDSDFFGNPELIKRAKEFAESDFNPPQHGIVIWSGADSILRIDPDLIETVFRKLHVVKCRVGMENFCDRSLREYSKGFKTLKKNLAIYQLDQDHLYEFPFTFSFLFFDPFTQPKDIVDNLDVIGDRAYEHHRLSPIEGWSKFDQTATLYRGTPMYERYVETPGASYLMDDYGNLTSWSFIDPLTAQLYAFILSTKEILRRPAYAMCALVNKHNESNPQKRITIRGDGLVNGYAPTLPGCLTCHKRQHGGRDFTYRLVEIVRNGVVEMISDGGFSEEKSIEYLNQVKDLVLSEFEKVSQIIDVDIEAILKSGISKEMVDVPTEKNVDFIEIDYGKGGGVVQEKISFQGHL